MPLLFRYVVLVFDRSCIPSTKQRPSDDIRASMNVASSPKATATRRRIGLRCAFNWPALGRAHASGKVRVLLLPFRLVLPRPLLDLRRDRDVLMSSPLRWGRGRAHRGLLSVTSALAGRVEASARWPSRGLLAPHRDTKCPHQKWISRRALACRRRHHPLWELVGFFPAVHTASAGRVTRPRASSSCPLLRGLQRSS